MDLDYSYCQGEQSPLGQHISANYRHGLYPTLISAEAESLSLQRCLCETHNLRKCMFFSVWNSSYMHVWVCLWEREREHDKIQNHLHVSRLVSCGFKMFLTEQGHNAWPLTVAVLQDSDLVGGWCHLAMTICRSQLSVDAQIQATRRGAWDLARHAKDADGRSCHALQGQRSLSCLYSELWIENLHSFSLPAEVVKNTCMMSHYEETKQFEGN